jgi:lysophospholipase L1-like esterase
MRNTIDRPFRSARGAVALLALAVAATACIDHDTPIGPTVQPLFERYVSLGNSITAGFQSGGIHLEFQHDAYPAVLAAKAGASFGVPELAMPGCPPPLAGPPPATTRISEIPCALRIPRAPMVVQNLAVPGANALHALHPLGTATTLNTLILGGRTQVTAMLGAEPSLVSVWLGNNDALSAALSGDTMALTPLADFQARYDQIVVAIDASPAQDAILIGVANAVQMAPALQPGAYFWAIGNPPSPFADMFAVDDNCAPGTAGGARMVSFLTVSHQLTQNPQGPVVINCAAEAPFVLTAEEMQTIGARVAAFNAHIQSRAEAHGWIYVDPMAEMFLPALPNPDLLRKCQGLPGATTPEQFAAAVQNTCPGPTAPNFFGSYFSYDGVHPSSEGHAVVADVLAARLNQKHGLTLPTGS